MATAGCGAARGGGPDESRPDTADTGEALFTGDGLPPRPLELLDGEPLPAPFGAPLRRGPCGQWAIFDAAEVRARLFYGDTFSGNVDIGGARLGLPPDLRWLLVSYGPYSYQYYSLSFRCTGREVRLVQQYDGGRSGKWGATWSYTTFPEGVPVWREGAHVGDRWNFSSWLVDYECSFYALTYCDVDEARLLRGRVAVTREFRVHALDTVVRAWEVHVQEEGIMGAPIIWGQGEWLLIGDGPGLMEWDGAPRTDDPGRARVLDYRWSAARGP